MTKEMAAARRGAKVMDLLRKGWALEPALVPPPLDFTSAYSALRKLGEKPMQFCYDSSAIDGGYYGFYPTVDMDGDTLYEAWRTIRARRAYLKDLRARRKRGETPGTRVIGARTRVTNKTLAVKTGRVINTSKKETSVRSIRNRRPLADAIVSEGAGTDRL